MNPVLAADVIRASMPEVVIATHLQVRAPLRLVGDDWVSPLSWSPGWFRPYAHQAAAFERLSTSKRFARSTVIVGDRGAGSTESYLYPILDHCLRQRRNSRPGVKALVVCATAGTAREHARRTATIVGWDRALDGVTVGCHPGTTGRGAAPVVVGEVMAPVDPDQIGAAPPDIVFTTAAALGSFMIDPGFEGLWSATTRESLRYVVVEDIQGYSDDALGELALGIRRVGAKLHMQTPLGGPPLGGATVVGTVSAPAMDDGQLEAVAALGSRLFGIELGLDSIVVESRHTAAELASAVDRSARVPTPAELAGLAVGDVAGIAAALGLADVAGDATALGSRLALHPLIAAVMSVASDRPTDLRSVLEIIGQWVPSWQVAAGDERSGTTTVAALGLVLGLLTAARRRVGSVDVALAAVDVHLWVSTADGEEAPAVLTRLLPALWAVGPSDGPARRTLVLTGSFQDASHGAAVVRATVASSAAGADAPAVLARDVTEVTAPETRAAVEAAFDAAHPEAPLVLVTPFGPHVGVDEGAVSTLVLLGAPEDNAEYRARIGNLGRDAGSSLTITVVGAGGRDRVVAVDAPAVVAGPLRMPSCAVDDVELLQRYLLAEAADEILSSGRRNLCASVTVEQVVRDGFDADVGADAVLDALVDAASDPARTSSFVGSLGARGPDSTDSESSAAPSLGSRPGMLFGRPIAGGGGAGSIAQPTEPAQFDQAADASARDESSLPSLLGGPSSDLPPLGSAGGRSVPLIDSTEVLDAVTAFAETGVEPLLTAAVTRWRDRTMVLRDRLRRTAVLTRAAAAGRPMVSAAALGREAPAVFDSVRGRRLQPWPVALVELGVLPDPSSCASGSAHDGSSGDGELGVLLWSQQDGGPQVRFHHRVPLREADRRGWPSSVVLPGSTVFAEAHRVLVDGLDTAPIAAAASDARRVVAVGSVTAQGPEESARDDGSAVAQPDRPVVAISADGAAAPWCLSAIPFGAQLLRDASFRASFGGRNVCSSCGVVHGMRAVDAADPQAVHRIWCAARTDPSLQTWVPAEPVSERRVGTALRIVLPVARFDVDRRVAGFEAVILAGIVRAGRPIHPLDVVHASTQDDGGARRQSLVLCTDSAAGAEVLEWLSDPTHFREVLEVGWRSGAAGGVAAAVEDVLRTGGQPGRVDSLDAVPFDAVERRELVDVFVETLRSWVQADAHADLLPGQDGAACGLVVTLEGNRHTYRVDVIHAEPGPRVRIRSGTSRLPPVIVVPSGGEVGQLDAPGLVWRLSWTDLVEFRSALRQGSSFEVPGVSLLSDQARAAADARQRSDGGAFDIAALEQNPLALLLDVLARPSVTEWRRVAGAVIESADGSGPILGDRGRSAWSNITGLARM